MSEGVLYQSGSGTGPSDSLPRGAYRLITVGFVVVVFLLVLEGVAVVVGVVEEGLAVFESVVEVEEVWLLLVFTVRPYGTPLSS